MQRMNKKKNYYRKWAHQKSNEDFRRSLERVQPTRINRESTERVADDLEIHLPVHPQMRNQALSSIMSKLVIVSQINGLNLAGQSHSTAAKRRTNAKRAGEDFEPENPYQAEFRAKQKRKWQFKSSRAQIAASVRKLGINSVIVPFCFFPFFALIR